MFQARRTRHFARSARRGEEKRKRLLITSTTRALITFNNLPLSAAKVRFALSKFSLCPSKHSGEKEKEGKPVENKFQGRASHYHEPHEAFLACQHLISKTQ